MKPETEITRLLDLMRSLRDPENGCPWDLEQDFASIAPHTIEEAYEVADAIERNDADDIRDELGDLLFQVVFHAQMADEANLFDFADVTSGITNKMIRRHPHVFGDQDGIASADDQTLNWEAQKAAERAAASAKAGNTRPSALDGVTTGLPALTRAVKLQNRAGRVGFDWPDLKPVLDKVKEEIGELESEVESGGSAARLEEEYGDILFVVANISRHLKLDPERALRRANMKFERRFRAVEDRLAEMGKSPETSNLQEMDALWDQIKNQE